MEITLRRDNNLKDDRFEKIRIRTTKDHFILTCPVCGYSFRPEMDPKHRKSKWNRCPMCGYKWNSPDFVDNNYNSSDKKFL
jgi:rubrerythrin